MKYTYTGRAQVFIIPSLPQVHELEMALDEESRRHQETIKILRKKERNVKELVLQCEEDHKNIQILQETLDKTYEKINLYKRQLNESVRSGDADLLFWSFLLRVDVWSTFGYFVLFLFSFFFPLLKV